MWCLYCVDCIAFRFRTLHSIVKVHLYPTRCQHHLVYRKHPSTAGKKLWLLARVQPSLTAQPLNTDSLPTEDWLTFLHMVCCWWGIGREIWQLCDKSYVTRIWWIRIWVRNKRNKMVLYSSGLSSSHHLKLVPPPLFHPSSSTSAP